MFRGKIIRCLIRKILQTRETSSSPILEKNQMVEFSGMWWKWLPRVEQLEVNKEKKLRTMILYWFFYYRNYGCGWYWMVGVVVFVQWTSTIFVCSWLLKKLSLTLTNTNNNMSNERRFSFCNQRSRIWGSLLWWSYAEVLLIVH